MIKSNQSVHVKKETERDEMVMLVIGEMGVGKTYRTNLEAKYYLMDHLAIGKKGRKILAFDVNTKDYPTFRTVSPDHIKSLKKVSARRILPFNKDGSPMTNNQKKEVVDKIINGFRDGMIVLDDMDSYMVGAKGQSVIGALVTVRHKGIDLLLSHQSASKVTTTEWQACTWLRLHHQVDDVTRYKDRIPKYHLVRIAQLIVDEQYDICSNAFEMGKISKQEYIVQKSFFVYVNMREQRIQGCSRAAFIRACKKFIDQEESKKVKMLMNERDFDENPIYKTRNDAVIKMISDKLRYHREMNNSIIY